MERLLSPLQSDAEAPLRESVDGSFVEDDVASRALDRDARYGAISQGEPESWGREWWSSCEKLLLNR
jgi:hypothetical protein